MIFSSSTPALGFCPSCRAPAPAGTPCPICGAPCDDPPRDYVERLLQTALSAETGRAGMAVDVLTKWLREPRALVPLILLIESDRDPYPLVQGARGLGWLRSVCPYRGVRRGRRSLTGFSPTLSARRPSAVCAANCRTAWCASTTCWPRPRRAASSS